MNKQQLLCGNYNYEDISTVVRDDQGNIKMIQMNVVNVNAITSDVALKIQEELNNYKSDEFSIKLGTFTRNEDFFREGTRYPYKNGNCWKCRNRFSFTIFTGWNKSNSA